MLKVELFQTYLGKGGRLSDADAQALADLCTEVAFAKEEAFIHTGGDGGKLALVRSGIFRALYMTVDGQRVIRRFYSQGQVMGSFAAAIARTLAQVTIEAIEPGRAYVFSYASFAELREQRPALEKASRLLLEAYYVQRESRARDLLTLDATARLRQFQLEYAEVGGRIAKGDIASYLGISPVSLSRILHPKPTDGGSEGDDALLTTEAQNC